jgi:hypothetical protein
MKSEGREGERKEKKGKRKNEDQHEIRPLPMD